MFSKYLVLAKVQWQNGLVYRTNFLFWRFRNVIQFLTIYFFWQIATRNQKEIFGYQEYQIFTYLFGVILLQSLILSSRTVDLAGDILESGLSNKLIKPISYFKYWFASDLADKLLNISFAVVEFSFLIWWLRPPLYLQTSPTLILIFLLSVILAFFLYFFINFTLGLIAFWTLEIWAPRFLFATVLMFLAGGLYPIDILPRNLYVLVKLTPFPYLLYFPMEAYLGRVRLETLVGGLIFSLFWTVLMVLIAKVAWQRGLRRYQAFGG